MSIVLQATETWLRSSCDFDNTQCGIQPRCEPPPIAGQWYVGIDDGGIDQTARHDSTGEFDQYLREVFTVEIGIWRRPGQFPMDRRRELMKNVSPYLLEQQSIESLERKIIVALHKAQGWRAIANDVAGGGLPLGGRGDVFSLPLGYAGRGKNETLALIRTSNDPDLFFGRRLRFRGATRTQALEGMQ